MNRSVKYKIFHAENNYNHMLTLRNNLVNISDMLLWALEG